MEFPISFAFIYVTGGMGHRYSFEEPPRDLSTLSDAIPYLTLEHLARQQMRYTNTKVVMWHKDVPGSKECNLGEFIKLTEEYMASQKAATKEGVVFPMPSLPVSPGPTVVGKKLVRVSDAQKAKSEKIKEIEKFPALTWDNCQIPEGFRRVLPNERIQVGDHELDGEGEEFVAARDLESYYTIKRGDYEFDRGILRKDCDAELILRRTAASVSCLKGSESVVSTSGIVKSIEDLEQEDRLLTETNLKTKQNKESEKIMAIVTPTNFWNTLKTSATVAGKTAASTTLAEKITDLVVGRLPKRVQQMLRIVPRPVLVFAVSGAVYGAALRFDLPGRERIRDISKYAVDGSMYDAMRLVMGLLDPIFAAIKDMVPTDLKTLMAEAAGAE